MRKIGKLVKLENNKAVVVIDTEEQASAGSFVKVGRNVGVVVGINLEDPDYMISSDKEESKVLVPDYLDERTSFLEIIFINEDIKNNCLGDAASILEKEEVAMMHETKDGIMIPYLHMLDDNVKVSVLRNLKEAMNDPVIDVLLSDIQWKNRIL